MRLSHLFRAFGGIVLLAVLWLGPTWLQYSSTERLSALTRIADAEHALVSPPDSALAQPRWLALHRLALLKACWGIALAAGGIALWEGRDIRRRHRLGGFLDTFWYAGLVGLALCPWAVVVYCFLPLPVAAFWVHVSLGTLVALTVFGLSAGHPYFG
jgi:hypothetical protein